MPIVGITVVSKEIDRFGSTITILKKTKVYSDYGDVTETSNTTASTVAVINALSSSDKEVQEGTYQTQDKRFFLKPDEDIGPGYYIVHNNLTYKIEENPQKHELQDTVYVIECIGKRVY